MGTLRQWQDLGTIPIGSQICFFSTSIRKCQRQSKQLVEVNALLNRSNISKKSERVSKQAGNGISRRHIKGSKIAQELQSVKYSPPQYPKNPKGGLNCRAKRGILLAFFNIHSVAKHLKNEGGPFEETNS